MPVPKIPGCLDKLVVSLLEGLPPYAGFLALGGADVAAMLPLGL